MPVTAPPPPARRRVAGHGGDAAHDLLDQLRGDAHRRPRVDPGLAGGLREWLEDGVAGMVADRPPDAPSVVVGRRALAAGLAGHGGTGTPPLVEEPMGVTLPLARGAMVAALFRQLVATGRVGDPVADALAALRAGGRDDDVAAFVEGLPAGDRRALHREVADHAATMAARWPAVAPGWYPRTGDRIAVPLAGSRVVLCGQADLLLGAPPGERASVCLVDVRSGTPRPADRVGLHFLGLLEALRSGAPPFRLATFYSATGELVAEEVPDTLLATAVQRTIEGVARRCGPPPEGEGVA